MIGCRPFTDIELDQLQLHMSQRDSTLLILGALTGFRISELLSLRVQDLVTPTGHPLPTVTVQRRHTKGRQRSRTVPLHPEAAAAVVAHVRAARLAPTDYVFKSREGDNRPIDPSQAHRVLKQATRLLGLQGKVATHSMRKYFANKVYEGSGKDIIMTQAALGHASVATTGQYLSFKTEALQGVLTAMRPLKP